MTRRQRAILGILVVTVIAGSATRRSVADGVFDGLDFFEEAARLLLEPTRRRVAETEEYLHPEPKPPNKAAEAWLDQTGLVVNDTNDSHEIYVLYSPTFAEIDVVIYDQRRREVYRNRFLTNDVLQVGRTGASHTPGLCRIYCRGGHDKVRYLLDIPGQIFGGDGDDDIRGGDNWDLITGGRGNDTLDGSWGSDVLYGGPDDDELIGGLDFDVFEGGDGDDIIDSRDKVKEVPIGDAGADLFLLDEADFPYDFMRNVDAYLLPPPAP